MAEITVHGRGFLTGGPQRIDTNDIVSIKETPLGSGTELRLTTVGGDVLGLFANLMGVGNAPMVVSESPEQIRQMIQQAELGG